jgi:hypothetical protein
MENIIDFFKKNKEQIVDYISDVGVNREKTKIKYGYIEGVGFNLVFQINNEPDKSITSFEEKIRYLFNAEIEDLEDLKNQIKPDQTCKIHCTPYLKINDSPVIHAFQMNISYKL